MTHLPEQDDMGNYKEDPTFYINTEHSDAEHVMAVWMKALLYIAAHGVTDCGKEHANEIAQIKE
jgi:hypothetical protein